MKKIFSILLVIAITISVLPTIVYAEEINNTILFLGDSISTGYGLEGYSSSATPKAKDSFSNIVSIKGKFNATNLAIDGYTSAQLLSYIETPQVKELLTNASIVSITIGGNDLLHAVYSALATGFGIDPSAKDMPMQLMEKIKIAVSSNKAAELAKIQLALLSVKNNIQSVSKNFYSNLTKIITCIKSMNANANIIIQTIYNPYKGIEGFESITEAGVQAINSVIESSSKANDYTVIDVYDAFDKSSEVLANAVESQKMFDPHPNKAGHALIAELLTNSIFDASKIFLDVKKTDWYYSALSYLLSENIISGETGTKFLPEDSVTPEYIAKCIYGCFSIAIPIPVVDKFDRISFCKLLVDALKTDNKLPEVKFKDRKITDFKDVINYCSQDEKSALEILYKAGAINYNANSNFYPHNVITKAEVAQICYSLIINK